MTKWYGSIQNRLDENKMFCDKIEKGTLLTEYFYSDCHPYEVVEVISQTHVKVRSLDHKAVGSHMSNEWELISNENNPILELKKRYGFWNWVKHWKKEDLETCYIFPGDRVYNKLITEGKAVEYRRANISFGIGEYYYDYTF